jgi:PAS domain S-box-containing protein
VAWFATDTVRVGGLRWTVSSWPMSSVQGLYRSDLREVIAVLGVIVSILVSLLLRLLYFTQAAARTVERERLQLALDSSTDGLWEQDLDTGESHRSEGVWRGLGYDPHTLTPRGATAVWDSLIHPEDRPRVQRALEEHLAGRTDTLDVEARLQARNGEWHWIVERGRVVERDPDGRPVRMLGAIADVTERKHAVQALAASERRFRAMFDGGAQIEMLLDLDCTCLEANRVALDFAGASLTEMRGKIIWETPSWAGSPVRVERLRKACEEAKLGKYVQYQEELDGPDGRRATIEFSIKPILGDEGQVIQLLAEGRDVTERKQVEATLRELESISTMGRLAAKVAHEINNPLAGILGNTQLLMLDRPETDPDFDTLKKIEQMAKRCKDITQNLLRFSQVREKGQLRAMDLNAVVRDAFSLSDNQTRGEGIAVVVKLQPGPLMVQGDPGHLSQVVLAMMQNARTAMMKSQVKELKIATRAEAQNAVLEITDTGKGISPDHLPRIYDPFFTTKDVWTNVGLGLSVAYRVVSEHQGKIDVATEVGKGTTFSVRIPRVASA